VMQQQCTPTMVAVPTNCLLMSRSCPDDAQRIIAG
jgi:hypothetical protein